jgi:hypothetical protein
MKRSSITLSIVPISIRTLRKSILSTMKYSITILSTTTFIKTTFSITSVSIMAVSKMIKNLSHTRDYFTLIPIVVMLKVVASVNIQKLQKKFYICDKKERGTNRGR